MPLPGITPAHFGAGLQYQVARSLRFDYAGSAVLNRTPTVTGERRAFTASMWIKRTVLGNGTGGSHFVYSAYLGSNDYTIIYFHNVALDTFSVQHYAGGVVRMQRRAALTAEDPTAWFHLCVSIDSRPATPTCIIEVNGVVYPPTIVNINNWVQNELLHANTANITNHIGSLASVGTYAAFYLAEYNIIDGQALSASNFGFFDSQGVWQPKKYTGQYGATGVYLPFLDNSSAATLGKDFTGMHNLETVSDDFANGSWWGLGNSGVLTAGQADPFGGTGAFKLAVGSSVVHPYVAQTVTFSAGQVNTFTIYAKAAGQDSITVYGGSVNGAYATFHLVAGYVINNGVVGTGSNTSAAIADIGGGWWKCSMTVTHNTAGADTVLIHPGDGSAVNGAGHIMFRLSITNGAAIPVELQKTDGLAITNKNFTATNFSINADYTCDSLVDSPTNYGTDTGLGGEVRGNYCVLNPLDMGSGVVLHDGNLGVSNAVSKSIRGTLAFQPSSNKFYWEVTIIAVPSGLMLLGITKHSDWNAVNLLGGSSAYTYKSDGTKKASTTTTAYGAAYTAGDIIGIAIDWSTSTGSITFYKNGVSQGVAWPAISTPGTGAVMPLYTADNAGCAAHFNFGQRPFAYPLAAHKSLCTQNLIVGSKAVLTPFWGNALADGPYLWCDAPVETITINGNVATRGVDFDSTHNGLKIRSASASFNINGQNTVNAATFGVSSKYSRAQSN